jgi:lipoyl(octanoyl) transferase
LAHESDERVLEFHLLGCLPWDRVWSLQQRLAFEAAGCPQPRIVVLCCEHPDEITIGRTGSRAHIRWTDAELRHEQLSWRWVARGGGCILHAPGQLCLYPILSLERCAWSVGQYLGRLQAALCATLADCGVQPIADERHRGVWGQSGLLAALGVAVHNWVTCHGAFVNVNPAMARFAHVETVAPELTPGGQKSFASCLLAERRLPIRMTQVRSALVPNLAQCFSCSRYHIQSGHPLLARYRESPSGPIARAS